MSVGTYYVGRPRIDLNNDGKITHDGDVCRVVLKRNLIHVACTDVTPAALRKLLAEHEKRFGIDDSIVLQAGNE